MITNNSITYYKKKLDNNKLTQWEKHYFDKVWEFGGKGSSINKGYENANDVSVRLPLSEIAKGFVRVKDINKKTVAEIHKTPVRELTKKYYISSEFMKGFFKRGDIIAPDEQPNISKQSDLNDVEFYNVTSININNFGNNPHVHLGGK